MHRDVTIPPARTNSFWRQAWIRLEPHALSLVLEVGVYVRYWLMVLVAHIVRVAMSYVGIDMWLIAAVNWMEGGIFLASFASLFWRILIGLYKETKRGKL